VGSASGAGVSSAQAAKTRSIIAKNSILLNFTVVSSFKVVVKF
jgi:hypothetical protein